MADSSSGRTAERKRHSTPVEFLIRLVKEKPLGTVGGVITLLLLFVGIFANFLAPYRMNQMMPGNLLPPSPKFWLGTDNLGRDILSRVIYGARISVVVGLVGSALSSLISTSIGMMCGYFGGKFDMVVQRFVDAVMCFPMLILLLVVISITGPGLWPVIIGMGLRDGIITTRLIRGAVLSTKENV
ncbi:unnamed protein product, partial [marine sediment metagenome]